MTKFAPCLQTDKQSQNIREPHFFTEDRSCDPPY
jgi:hypothetical protein